MIAAVSTLLLCQLLGEVLVRAFGLPLPGPVAGLGLLFAGLVVRGRLRPARPGAVPEDLGRTCDVLLGNLSLLFIPAAVGVVQYLALLRSYAVPIALAIVASTVLALVVTALVFRLVSGQLARLSRARGEALVVDPARDP